MIKTIAENMKKCRIELRMTQQDVADKCGLFRASYTRIESGTHDFRISTLDRIAKALQVNPVDLLN